MLVHSYEGKMYSVFYEKLSCKQLTASGPIRLKWPELSWRQEGPKRVSRGRTKDWKDAFEEGEGEGDKAEEGKVSLKIYRERVRGMNTIWTEP